MVLKNIIRYKKRSFKIMFIFLAIVFATLSFFFIKTGYKNLYEDIGSINQGEYYIKAKTTEEIPILTSNVELITCYGSSNYHNSKHFYLDNVDLGFTRSTKMLIYDFNKLPEYLGLKEGLMYGEIPKEKDEIIINYRLAKLMAVTQECSMEDLLGKRLSLDDEEYAFIDCKIACIVQDDCFRNFVLGDNNYSAYIIFSKDLNNEFIRIDSSNAMTSYIYLNKYELLEPYFEYFDTHNIENYVNSYESYQKNHFIIAQFEIVNTIIFIIILAIVLLCIVNIFNSILIKFNDQYKYFKMLRSLGFSSKKCQWTFQLENLYIYIFSFVLGTILSIVMIDLLNKHILVEEQMSLKLSTSEYSIIIILVFLVYLAVIGFINFYVLKRNRGEKA